jgi:hypothetical protein
LPGSTDGVAALVGACVSAEYEFDAETANREAMAQFKNALLIAAFYDVPTIYYKTPIHTSRLGFEYYAYDAQGLVYTADPVNPSG